MHSRITAPRTRRGIALPSRDASQPGDASFQFVRDASLQRRWWRCGGGRRVCCASWCSCRWWP